MTAEKTIEQKLVRAVKLMGGLAPKFVSPGLDGVPDRIVLLPGAKLAFVELKAEVEAPADESTDGLTVSLPMDGFTELALDNLKKLLEAKGTLIQKALGADRLTVETSEDRVSFPWWDHLPGNDETQAYMAFIAALCAMAKEAKRVTAKEPDAESEKYAFRCFLLRLGFIGADSKAQRKLLLQKLSGSSAFRTAEEARKFSEAQKAKRDAAKAAAADTDSPAGAEEVAVCE